MARVVYRDENYQTFYVDINDQQPEVTIGRNQGNMILIPAKSLSRYHAKIVYQNRRYFLIDLKSSNGTYVNNVRINQQEIHPGDKIRFGEIAIDFVDDARNSFGGQAGQVNNPQPAMPQMGSMQPQRPSMPPAMQAGPSKMNSPKVQMFNPGLQPSAPGPDLRSVSMRPISNGGTYRPTMPNQPSYDDSMAKMAEQIASPSALGLDAAAAPVTFDPNSMGIRQQSPIRNLASPIAASNPYAPPVSIDPAAAPVTFNPGSMGVKPIARPGMPSPDLPGSNKFLNSQQGGLDPSVAPMSFNPNSMGIVQNSAPANAPSIGMPSAGPASMNSNAASIPSGMMSASAGVTAPSGGMEPFSPEISDPNENSRLPGLAGASAPSGLSSSKNLVSVSSLDPEQSTALHKVDHSEHAENVVSPVLEQVANEFEGASDAADRRVEDVNELSGIPRRASVSRGSGEGFAPAVSGFSRRAARPGAYGRAPVADAPAAATSSSSSSPSMPAVSNSFARSGRPMPGRGRMPTHFSPRADSADNSQLPGHASDEISASHENVAPDAQDDLIHDVNAGDFLPNDLPENGMSLAMDVPDEASAALDESKNNEEPASELKASVKLPEPVEIPVSDVFDELRHSLDLEAISRDDVIVDSVAKIPEKAEAETPEPAPDAEVAEAENEAPAAEPAAAVSNEEIEKLNAQIEALQEKLADSEQMVEMLKAAMAELKDENKTKLAELQTQMDAEISSITAQKDETISQLNVDHLQELSRIKNESEQALQDALTRENDLQNENNDLKNRLSALEKASGDVETFVPKWSSRFDALIQYAKAMERAVDKLQLDTVEPKAFEYVRSMSDMIRFCADDLKRY